MAKKAFEKREAQLHKFDAFSELNVYKELADFREKKYDMERMKHIITFVFVILEALVIWILAYFL